MANNSGKIATRYFSQAFMLCMALGVVLSFALEAIAENDHSLVQRLAFCFLTSLVTGISSSIHAYWVLIRPMHELKARVESIQGSTVDDYDAGASSASELPCEFAAIEDHFQNLLDRLQHRHKEVLLTKINLNRLSRNLEAELDLRGIQLKARVAASFQENKLHALGEMAAGIAHEINNPLAILVGRTEQLREILRQGTTVVPKQEAILSNMETTMERIQAAVRDLELIAANPSQEELRKIPLRRLLDRLTLVIKSRFRYQEIGFETEVEGDLEIEGRESELSHALLDLIENASEAAQVSDGKWVKVSLQRLDEDTCAILISDSGAGVDEAIRDQLFQPFFSTKREGRGMGLSLAKSAVEGHRGQLTFDFSQGRTILHIHLPLRQSDKGRAVAA